MFHPTPSIQNIKFLLARCWKYHDGHTVHKNPDDIYDMSWGWMSHLRKKGQKQYFLGGWHGICENRGGMVGVWYHPIDVLGPPLSMVTPDMIILAS